MERKFKTSHRRGRILPTSIAFKFQGHKYPHQKQGLLKLKSTRCDGECLQSQLNERLKEEDYKSELSLANLTRPHLKTTIRKQKTGKVWLSYKHLKYLPSIFKAGGSIPNLQNKKKGIDTANKDV